MFRRKKPEWQKLISGLYVPPYLKFGAGYPCPECCDVCPHCTNTPTNLSVTITGITDTPSCDQCTQFNGTFVLDGFKVESPSLTDICHWQYDVGACVVDSKIFAHFGFLHSPSFCRDSPANKSLSVSIVSFPFGIVFKKVFATPYNCTTWSSENLPLCQDATFHCDTSSPTCHVTAF